MRLFESNDQKNEDMKFPEYLTPRQPVLEEPFIETGKQPAKEDGLGDHTCADVSRDEKDGVPALIKDNLPEGESCLELTPMASEDEADTPNELPISPYFPRGIYEDAQTVDAYYGRSTPTRTYDPFTKIVDPPERPTRSVIKQVALVLLLMVVILGLVLLAVKGGIIFPFM